MKRAPALQPLSHGHQHALAVAVMLRRADATGAAEAARAFTRFWHAEGRAHFHDEEEVLLPAYAEFGDPGHPLVVRVLVDHVTIRQRARAIERRAPERIDAAGLQDLGMLLASHVRLEERELFPLIEAALPAAALAEVADALVGAEGAR